MNHTAIVRSMLATIQEYNNNNDSDDAIRDPRSAYNNSPKLFAQKAIVLYAFWGPGFRQKEPNITSSASLAIRRGGSTRKVMILIVTVPRLLSDPWESVCFRLDVGGMAVACYYYLHCFQNGYHS